MGPQLPRLKKRIRPPVLVITNLPVDKLIRRSFENGLRCKIGHHRTGVEPHFSKSVFRLRSTCVQIPDPFGGAPASKILIATRKPLEC